MTDLHKTSEPVAWSLVGDGKFGEYKIGDQFTKLDVEYWKSRGYELVPLYASPPSLDALIADAVAKEREACARIAESFYHHIRQYTTDVPDIEQAIRERGQK